MPCLSDARNGPSRKISKQHRGSLICSFAALTALVVGLVVVPSPASASTSRTKVSSADFGSAPGRITCDYAAKVTISPSLTPAGGGTGASSVKGSTTSCAASSSGVAMTSKKVSGSFSDTPFTCQGMLTGTSVTLAVKWKGTYFGNKEKFTNTTVSGTSAAGSFAGPASVTVTPPTSSSLAPGCASKKGLKKFEITGTLTLGTPVNVVKVVPYTPTSKMFWTAPSGNVPWQWYLSGKLDLGSATEMGYNDTLPNGAPAPDPVVYDIDGIENLAPTVQGLHDLGDRAICYIEVGSAGNYYSAADEGIPVSYFDQLQADGDLGAKLDGYPENFLNITSKSTLQIIEAMIQQQCSAKRFDAVETDLDETFGTNEGTTGFDITEADEATYLEELSAYMQGLGLGWIAKNLDDTGDDFATTMQPFAQGIISEQCNEYSTCSRLAAFPAHGKAVFNAEYQPSLYPGFCTYDDSHGINGALFNVGLNGSRKPCVGP
jgi:hypothetical protein